MRKTDDKSLRGKAECIAIEKIYQEIEKEIAAILERNRGCSEEFLARDAFTSGMQFERWTMSRRLTQIERENAAWLDQYIRYHEGDADEVAE